MENTKRLVVILSSLIIASHVVVSRIREEKAMHNSKNSLIQEDNNHTMEDNMLREFAAGCDCSSVRRMLRKMSKNDTGDSHSLQLRLQLRKYLLYRGSRANCALSLDDETDVPGQGSSLGDGWCDRIYNSEEYDYDDGDCCSTSCISRSRDLPCGINGYDCLIDDYSSSTSPPYWFTNGTQLCYEWYPDGDGGQCGGGAARQLCAYPNQWTNYYRDDTDGRPGGCRMRWGISSFGPDQWFNSLQVCYRWYADGDSGQCFSRSNGEFCTAVNQDMSYYRDDTDGRPGGCRMSWRLFFNARLPSKGEWLYGVKLCYRWYADGDGGQCGGGASKQMCVSPGQWTPYYRDDTDGRSGGCRMSWGLFY